MPLRSRLCLLALSCIACADPGGDGDGAQTEATGGDAADDAMSTVPGETAMPEDDGVATMADDTAGPDSSDTGDVVDPTHCWEVSALGTIRGEPDRVAFVDGDGDGDDELWAWQVGATQEETQHWALALDGDEQGTVAGVLLHLADVDGDGSIDAITSVPRGRSFHAGDGAMFVDRPVPLVVPGDDPIAGAFDMDGDGIADLVLRSGDSGLEIARGLGDGTFEAAGSVGIPTNTELEAFGGGADGSRFPIRSRVGPGRKGCDVRHYDTVVLDGLEPALSGIGPTGDYGRPLAFADLAGDGVADVVVERCDTLVTRTDTRVLADDGSGRLAESTLLDGVAWQVAADLDGDGTLDHAWGDETDGAMLVRFDLVSDAAPEATGVGAGTVIDNAVWTADLDGDGAFEIVRALAGDDTVAYERIAIVPCR